MMFRNIRHKLIRENIREYLAQHGDVYTTFPQSLLSVRTMEGHVSYKKKFCTENSKK